MQADVNGNTQETKYWFTDVLRLADMAGRLPTVT